MDENQRRDIFLVKSSFFCDNCFELASDVATTSAELRTAAKLEKLIRRLVVFSN